MKSISRSISRVLKNVSLKPIKYFVLVSLIGGVGLIITIPPFQIPDEFVHFTRAYEVSELKNSTRFNYGGIDYKGSELPSSIMLTYNKTRLNLPKGSPDLLLAKKYSLNQSKKALDIPLNKQQVKFYDIGAVPAYFPPLYFPQAIIIKLLSALNSPVIVMLYFTRLMGLFVWIMLAGIALKIFLPSKRKFALASVLLIPMFLAQASASTDALLNGVTLLYFVIVARYIYTKKQIELKGAILLIFMLGLMILAKPVYLVFGLLIFMLPLKQKGFIGLGYRGLLVAVPLLIYFAWVFLTNDNGPPIYLDTIASGRADPSSQVAYLLPNIINFLQPLINTLFLGFGDGIYSSLIGSFGKLDTPLPDIFIVLGYLFVSVAIFANSKSTEDTKESRLQQNYYPYFIAIISVFFVIGIYLAMYIYSTPPGSRIVTGVQGRYLLPLIPLLTIFVTKNWVMMKNNAYNTLLIFTPILLVFTSVIIIFLRFHVTYP